LLEAAVQATIDERAVALVAYDVPMPDPLNSLRPIGASFGVALIVTPHPSQASFVRLDVEVRRGTATSAMASEALETLRQGTPAARSLPLLAALARNARDRITLDFVPHLEIAVTLEPMASARTAERRRQPDSVVQAC
jgi:hypothetical protein